MSQPAGQTGSDMLLLWCHTDKIPFSPMPYPAHHHAGQSQELDHPQLPGMAAILGEIWNGSLSDITIIIVTSFIIG